LEEAVNIFERAQAQGGDAHYGLGRTLYFLARYDEALAHQRLAVKVVQSDPANGILPLQDLALTLVATGQYTEAVHVNDKACRLAREHEAWPFLARGIENSAGFHLEVFDYAGSEALAQETIELARSVDFVPAEVSAKIDLMFNFARRGEVGRAVPLVDEVAAALDEAMGAHGWLWRLRLAQARAEIALARGEWDETLRLVDIALQHDFNQGRVKFQVLGLKTRAQALAALGRIDDATVDLRNALAFSRSIGDPALIVKVAASLLAIERDDALAREAYGIVQRISAALPNDEMRRLFEAAEPVQQIVRLGG
jgi:tetratricopeptide (TPR) repeat protein